MPQPPRTLKALHNNCFRRSVANAAGFLQRINSLLLDLTVAQRKIPPRLRTRIYIVTPDHDEYPEGGKQHGSSDTPGVIYLLRSSPPAPNLAAVLPPRGPASTRTASDNLQSMKQQVLQPGRPHESVVPTRRINTCGRFILLLRFRDDGFSVRQTGSKTGRCPRQHLVSVGPDHRSNLPCSCVHPL